MEFTYSGSINIEEKDLDEMARRVARGEGFHDVFDSVMSHYNGQVYWTCDFVEEKVEIEVMKRVDKTMLFSEFVEKYCLATGGNWTQMLADGIERAFPSVYLEKVFCNDCSFKDLVDILWEDCGVVFD